MTAPKMRDSYASRVREELIGLAERGPERGSTRSADRPARAHVVLAAVIALALVVPAAVFALSSRPVPIQAQQRTQTAVPSQALRLIPATWRVRDAAGEAPATWIIFDTTVTLIRPRGDVFLLWSSQRDALLTQVDGWSMTLGTSKPPTVPWLTSTTRFVRNDKGWTLLDASGRQTARLVHDGTPPPSEQSLNSVPKLQGILLEQHTDAVAGATVQPVDSRDAVGTWGLPGVAAGQTALTLRSDGTWTAKTSCGAMDVPVGGAGAYRVLPTGFALVTEQPEADAGCYRPASHSVRNGAAITEFGRAGSVAITGDEMTVYDRKGVRLGTLHRKS